MQRFNKIRQLVDQLEEEMVSLIKDRQELEEITENEVSKEGCDGQCHGEKY